MGSLITFLGADRAKQNWDDIKGAFSPIVDWAMESFAQFRKMVFSGQIDIWVISDNANGFIATQISAQNEFVILYAIGDWGGKDDTRIIANFFWQLAKANNCHSLKFIGRKGWGRLFPEFDVKKRPDGRFEYERLI